MKNGILVLSTSAINTHSFAAQLTGHPIAPDESVVPWTLQTKYYTASVRLWLDTLDDTSDVTAVVESLGDAVDGLVLLFDSEKPDTFEAVKPWKEFVSDAAPGVALCFDVSTASTPSTVADGVLDEAAAWCADNGLELVCAEEAGKRNSLLAKAFFAEMERANASMNGVLHMHMLRLMHRPLSNLAAYGTRFVATYADSKLPRFHYILNQLPMNYESVNVVAFYPEEVQALRAIEYIRDQLDKNVNATPSMIFDHVNGVLNVFKDCRPLAFPRPRKKLINNFYHNVKSFIKQQELFQEYHLIDEKIQRLNVVGSPALERFWGTFSTRYQKKIAEDGEDSIQRVIQALEANAWDGLVMNDAKEKNVGGMAGTLDDDTLPSVTVAANWKAAAAAEFGDDDDDYLDLNQVLEREEGTLQSMLAEMNVNDLDDDEFGEFMASTGSQINAGAKKSEFDFDIPELDEFDPTNASQETKDLRAALFGDVDDDDFFEKAIGQIKNLRDSANSMSDDKRRDMARKLAMALLSDE